MPQKILRRIALSVFALVLALYPLLVYLTLGHFSPRYLAALLAAAAIARAIWARQKFWIAAALGALALAVMAFHANSLAPLKLYPVLVNAVFLAVFGASLLWPPSAIERLARLRHPDLPQEAQRYTRRVTIVWCAFFIMNGAIALATALWASEQLWALYNGFIAYILMGALFMGEFLTRKMVMKRADHV